MQPEIDYTKVGQRIKTARQIKGMTQAQLGAATGCSNNHMSHMETGQTKASLEMLLKLARALDQELDYFILDTPYAPRVAIIDTEIAAKLNKCKAPTLRAVNKVIDVLLEQQETLGTAN